MLKKVIEIMIFPMNLNVYNIADAAVKGINKVAEMETSEIVRSKDFNEAEFVESTVC